MQETNQKGRSIAIVAMIFLFGMIAFVTNLAAPIGVIWKTSRHSKAPTHWECLET